MRVGILGPLHVEVADRCIEIGGDRLRVFLARLAMEAGRVVSVEELSDALWPDDKPNEPSNALHSLVSRLRKTLRHDPSLRKAPGGYVLDIPPENVDLLRFERLVKEGRGALGAGDARAAADTLRQALALWRGNAMESVARNEFTQATATRLGELRLAAIEQRVEADLAVDGAHAGMVAELEELIVAHPLRENLRVLLMKALHSSGRHAEALAAHEEFRTLLSDELGAHPGPALQAVHLAVLRHEALLPAPSTAQRHVAPPAGGNVRTPLSSFVGREMELAVVREALSKERLVTLVGPGGAGKTRLACQFAVEVSETYPGGIWLVELAPVTDAADVVHTVADTLDLHEGGGGSHNAVSLAEALPATDTLIVLDNCEHLIDAIASFTEELLSRTRRVRVLATSREPLRIDGEILCRVDPLALPEPGASTAGALRSPSVRLFAERAAAVRPGFALSDDNVALVTEICTHLDGLPLAIELAAARLRSMSLAELAKRLTDRFVLLTSGSRTALPRHRTLRAIFAWSWDLLTDEERHLAQRLAVFPGTITPESAMAVYAPPGPGLAEEALLPPALEVLSALVDKSLLQMTEGPETRYRMLETIREYGLERLAAEGDLTRARAWHAAHFRTLAERTEPMTRGVGQLEGIRILAAEHDNLVAAFHYARESGDAETVLRMAAALGYFWTVKRNHAEAAGRLRQALEVRGPAPRRARTDATAFYLLNCLLSGDSPPRDVDALCARARPEHAPERDSLFQIIEVCRAWAADNAGEGVARIDRFPSPTDPWTRAVLRLLRACLHSSDGEMTSARRDLGAAERGFRQAEDRWGRAVALSLLAHTHAMGGNLDGAIADMTESVRLLAELGSDAATERIWLAEMRAQQGDTTGARALLYEIADQDGRAPTRHAAYARMILGDVARWEGDLEQAAAEYRAAHAQLAASALAHPQLRAMLCTSLAWLALDLSDLEAVERHLTDAREWSVQAPDLAISAGVTVGTAALRARQGAVTAGAELLGLAHALRGAADPGHPDVARLTRKLRGELGEAGFAQAYARGRADCPPRLAPGGGDGTAR
ncbi:BTAD domain-containing putative transcriptional regulator [Streptomyces coeruleorubidus]|uniref:BTAD domain-containing putative transcriptional regulator n=1 Tax=Streptomyces coeruleorubidus TaxID=116188 RepID=UPI0037A5BB55